MLGLFLLLLRSDIGADMLVSLINELRLAHLFGLTDVMVLDLLAEDGLTIVVLLLLATMVVVGVTNGRLVLLNKIRCRLAAERSLATDMSRVMAFLFVPLTIILAFSTMLDDSSN